MGYPEKAESVRIFHLLAEERLLEAVGQVNALPADHRDYLFQRHIGPALNRRRKLIFDALKYGDFEKAGLLLEGLTDYIKIDLDSEMNSVRLAAKKKREEKSRKLTLIRLNNQIKIQESSVTFSPPRLRSTDLSLICNWLNVPVIEQTFDDALLSLANAFSRHEVERLLSARSAELVAIEFLNGQYGDAKDISLTQIEEDRDSWRTHDIETPNDLWDVKNARRNFSSRDRYSELCVPNFKIARDKQKSKEVNILGTLSDYRSLGAFKSDSLSSVVVLGYSSKSRIETLSEVTKAFFSGLVDLSAIPRSASGSLALPAWLLCYPDSIYSSQKTALSELLDFHDSQKAHEDFRRAPLDLMAAVLGLETKYTGKIMEHYFPRTLLEVIKCNGRNLSSIVACIFGVVANTANEKGGNVGFDLMDKWIFPIDKAHPLGVYDPLEYVHGFLAALREIYSSRSIKSIKAFRLLSPHILQGLNESGDWMTVLAYCGGWISQDNLKVKCGKYPLIIGQSNTCLNCKKLICTNCGFCSSGCSQLSA